ncbi:glutathione S-transferase family protein [Emcibacter nanhaiensis]|uniref:Glutathione S-transferase family protein n=1 Tax=Emcibacter nanhaiensis TaxID=1505037 RepID=A0A501PKZ7_9PROT|nr:glutathione S-transferase family protein [Emcibacter nanhaiensis]TPD60772.1 glutathione S-transferase family protein [Emcibacter nanhaiensis]
MIRLFHRTDCPFCWKVRIALFELGVPVEETVLALGEKSREVRDLNPNNSVPVMITDKDTVIWESAAMVEYVAERFGAGRLFEGSAEDRARIRQLHIFSDNRVGKAVFPIVRERRNNPGREVPEELLRRITAEWTGCLSVLERELRDREFFGGESFSAADCALMPRFTLAEVYGLPVPDTFPKAADWYRRTSRRASVIQARPDKFPGVNDLVKSAE